MKLQSDSPALNGTHAISPSARAEKRSSIIFPIVGAFLLPILIGLLKPTLIGTLFSLFYLLALLLPPYIMVRIFYDWARNERSFFGSILQYVRPLPPGLVFGADLKKYVFPWVTTALVLINGVIYFAVPEEIKDVFVFFPHGDPSLIHILISAFTSAFLHADFWHYLGNMIFLWAFGSTIEPRIGSSRYFLVYFLCIIASKVIVFTLLSMKSMQLDSPATIENFHSLGASGAIAGIMGIFVVRCYFARVSVSFPFLFIPFLSLSLRVQGTFLISLFFAKDIAGSVAQFDFDHVRINYWSHMGGYLGGFVMGYLFKLHRAASEEAVKVKAQRLDDKPYSKKEATQLYGDILNDEPENEAALRYFLNLRKFNPEKAQLYYVHLMQVLIKKDVSQAVSLFREYFPKFMNALPGQVLLRLGAHFYQSADLKRAQPCLELASSKEGPWQAKALLSLGRLFEDIGSLERSKMLFKEVAVKFPDSPFGKIATEKLTES
jgi:membrane associated rhomboid family serine protease